jgi:DNA-binding NarL/FixJ family response regulator
MLAGNTLPTDASCDAMSITQEDRVPLDRDQMSYQGRKTSRGMNATAAGEVRPRVCCLLETGSKLHSRLRQEQFWVIRDVTSVPAEFLASVAEREPDLALVDMDVTGHDMMECLRDLRLEFPSLSILAVSDDSDPGFITAVLKAGASSYIHTMDDSEAIRTSLEHALDGDVFVSVKHRGGVLRSLLGDGTAHGHPPVHLLSAREAQVFRYLSQKFTIREIAQELDLSSRTVETYRDRIREKLHVRDSRQLVTLAIRWVINERRSDS